VLIFYKILFCFIESKRTIVFVKTKWSADFLAAYLCELSIPSTSIHGDRPQNLKKEALNDFNEGKMNVIVTTSTALKNLGNLVIIGF